MRGVGQALSHGAITILNAFATGKGGALGIELWTRARVNLTREPGDLLCFNSNGKEEPTTLMRHCVELTLDHFGVDRNVGGSVATWSNIPTAVGLKSSSAASNAIVMATISALGKEQDDNLVLDIATRASLDSKVSLTGAYDDACASYYGGGVITDNSQRKILKRFQCPTEASILILVPSRKRYTGELELSSFNPVRGISEIAYREAMDSNPWQAMTLNGLGCAAVLGEDQDPVIAALRHGALGAGISGKGPAVAAIVDGDKRDKVREAWGGFQGQIIETLPNTQKAILER